MATDLGKELFDFASTLVRAQSAMVQRSVLRPNRPVVYLLFHGEIVLGVCGNRDRADREAEELGHAFNAVIRIEPREVHS